MKRWLFIAALPVAIAAGLALSVAIAGSPFGGDETPPPENAREVDGGSAMPVPPEDGGAPVDDTVVEGVDDGAPGPDIRSSPAL